MRSRSKLDKEKDKIMVLDWIDMFKRKEKGEKIFSFSFFLKYEPFSVVICIFGIIFTFFGIIAVNTQNYLDMMMFIIFGTILYLSGLILMISFITVVNRKLITVIFKDEVDKFYNKYFEEEVENAK